MNFDMKENREERDALSLREKIRNKFSNVHKGISEQSETPETPFGRKKIIAAVLGACTLVVIVAAVIIIRRPKTSVIPLSDTDTLASGEFKQSISATGRVESAASVSVYSTTSYTVETVLVKVGDTVTEGQLLAELDEKNIQNQIDSQEASMRDAATNASQQIKSASDTYYAAKDALDNGINSSIISAQSQVTSAKENYEKAVENYNRYHEEMDNDLNSSLLSQGTSLINARNAVDSAQIALEEAENMESAAKAELESSRNELQNRQKELESLQTTAMQLYVTADEESEAAGAPEMQSVSENTIEEAYNIEEPFDNSVQIENLNRQIEELKASISTQESAYESAVLQVERAEQTLRNAKENLSIVLKQYEAAKVSADQTLEDYSEAVGSAYQSYQDALNNLEAAEAAANAQLQSYKNSLSSAQANAGNQAAEVSLNQLKVELDSTNITAPCSGTVTAVYANVGESGSGLLFVIEDLDHLVVNSSVKEYDIGTVQTGMQVEIKSEATGDKNISGEISSIAPTSMKSADGSTNISGDVEFATNITVSDRDTGLLIGMSVELEYIVEQLDQTMRVSYDEIYQNSAGEDCILALEKQKNGKYLVKEYTIETGIENDLEIAISGEELCEGMLIVANASDYQGLVGQLVELSN